MKETQKSFAWSAKHNLLRDDEHEYTRVCVSGMCRVEIEYIQLGSVKETQNGVARPAKHNFLRDDRISVSEKVPS